MLAINVAQCRHGAAYDGDAAAAAHLRAAPARPGIACVKVIASPEE